MSFPQPTRRDHDKFCRTEGWQEVHNARSGTVRHHITYELDLVTGERLRTRISRPACGDVYGAAIWQHILRDQLQVKESIFWACARDGVVPDRGTRSAPSAESLPADLVHILVNRAGVPETEVAAMTKEQAVERLNQYWAQGQ